MGTNHKRSNRKVDRDGNAWTPGDQPVHWATWAAIRDERFRRGGGESDWRSPLPFTSLSSPTATAAALPNGQDAPPATPPHHNGSVPTNHVEHIQHSKLHAGQNGHESDFANACVDKILHSGFLHYDRKWRELFDACITTTLRSHAIEAAAEHSEHFAEGFPDLLCERFLETAIATNRTRPMGGKTHDFMLDTSPAGDVSLKPQVANALTHFAQDCIREFWKAPARAPARAVG